MVKLAIYAELLDIAHSFMKVAEVLGIIAIIAAIIYLIIRAKKKKKNK